MGQGAQPVRDGPVPRETYLEKGRRYASEARLTIHHVSERRVRATCKGSGTVHELGWDPEPGWWCSCLARTTCSHLAALQLVVARDD